MWKIIYVVSVSHVFSFFHFCLHFRQPNPGGLTILFLLLSAIFPENGQRQPQQHILRISQDGQPPQQMIMVMKAENEPSVLTSAGTLPSLSITRGGGVLRVSMELFISFHFRT